MESSLPFALRVAAGLVSESLGVVRRLPTEIATLPVTVIGQVAKLSFQLNQQLTDLATSGDHLLASLHAEPAPPERTAWSTIDDEDATTGEAATTWDETPEEPPVEPLVAVPAVDAVIDDELPDGVISTTEELGHPLIEDLADLAIVEDAAEETSARADLPTPHLTAVPTPAGAPDVSTLTIAQLRSRVRSMSAEQVRDALEREQSGKERPAFLTVLTNRLSTLARAGE